MAQRRHSYHNASLTMSERWINRTQTTMTSMTTDLIYWTNKSSSGGNKLRDTATTSTSYTSEMDTKIYFKTTRKNQLTLERRE